MGPQTEHLRHCHWLLQLLCWQLVLLQQQLQWLVCRLLLLHLVVLPQLQMLAVLQAGCSLWEVHWPWEVQHQLSQMEGQARRLLVLLLLLLLW